MSDDKTQRGPEDRTRIALDQPHEVRYWTEKLGVSEETLAQAVHEAGPSSEKVAAYVAQHGDGESVGTSLPKLFRSERRISTRSLRGRNSRTLPPIWNVSPGCRKTSRTRRLRARVPFVEPRSRSRQPSSPSSISQCTRETAGSVSTIWQSEAVPMRIVDASTCACFPASGPDFTVTAHLGNSIDVGRPSRRKTRVGWIGPPDEDTLP